MDLLYVAILIAFFALTGGLAAGCSYLQKPKARRLRNTAEAAASPPALNGGTTP